MKVLSGLNDILDDIDQFKEIIPNINNVIDAIFAIKHVNEEKYYSLEKKLVSLVFAIKLVKEDIIEINKLIEHSNRIVNKYFLQKTVFNYLAHIDSSLDYFDKFINILKSIDIKYERKFFDFDNTVNVLRNSVLHEGIPTIHVTYAGKDYSESYSCTQWAGSIESSINDYYLQVEIDGKKYDLYTFINTTYYPMLSKITEIMSKIS